jgi:serine/threonine protein kinase
MVAGVRQWVRDRTTPLGRILIDKSALRASDLAAVELLVARLLEKHGGDVEKSMASLGAVRGVRVALEGVADADLQSCLERVAALMPREGAAAEAPPAAGPRFRIVRLLTEGQLGNIYLGRDDELERDVVIKEIHARHAGDPDCDARFEREVKYATELEHPGIVPIYGAGRHPDGRRFYAMRYIQGENLRAAIERFHKAGGNPAERLRRLRTLIDRFAAVCRAIAYAHERGVLHRDIKPENVMLSEDGEAIVVDWGLAKPLAAAGRASPAEKTLVQQEGVPEAALTTFGQVVGTQAYMSPEQAAGELDRLGPASDVYSLGATLYCLLTGQPPYVKAPAQTEPLLSLVQRGEFPPPRRLRPDVPRDLEAICLKAMDLRPDRRYASAKALADDLECWLAGEPVVLRPLPWTARLARSARRHPLLAVGAVAVPLALVTAVALDLFLHGGPPVVATPPNGSDTSHLETQLREAQEKLKRAQGQLDSVAQELTGAKADGEEARKQRDDARRQRDEAEGKVQGAAKDAKEARAQLALANADKERVKKIAAEQVAEAKQNVDAMAAKLNDAREASESGYTDAIETLEGLKTKDPTVRRTLGLLHRKLGDARFEGERLREAAQAYRKAIAVQEQLILPEIKEELAQSRNNLAWLLATSGDVSLRDPDEAVKLAEKAHDAVPKRGDYCNTFGVALYRKGVANAQAGSEVTAKQNWQTALQALEKARKLVQSTKRADEAYVREEVYFTTLFFMAMTQWRLGNVQTARQWYDCALCGLEGMSESAELARFRKVAGGLLGAP